MRVLEKLETKRVFVTLDNNESDALIEASFKPPEDGWRLDHIDRIDDDYMKLAYITYSRLTFPAS